MTQPLGTYSFLPWLRQGLANQITAADLDPEVAVRATIDVELRLTGDRLDGGTDTETLTRPVGLYGPGDIVGIDSRAIVRVEPRHWTTDVEPTYLAQMEFYDEDFPWRYTPAAPDGETGRLRPWIALIVLTEEEFTEGGDARDRPLPSVDVVDPGMLPPAEELWAWAHVHVNRSLAANDEEFTSDDMAAVIPRLEAVLAEDPDLAYARLMCPRRLAENTAYHAFLVPAFETGRLAGLGLDPAGSPHATFSAWAAYPAATKPLAPSLPYYHRWFFRTGRGDFESLVRLLVPRPVDPRVGNRDLDVLAPGAGLPPLDDPALHGVLPLGGALKVPGTAYDGSWAEPYPHPFQRALADVVNLADDFSGGELEPEPDDPDPLVTPPLYGTWHALTRRLLTDRGGDPVDPDDNWVHELNLDPRHRVSAGFGTRVVQDRQEQYMAAAWEQIGDVLEANQRIRFGQLAVNVSTVWYEQHLAPLARAGREQATRLLAPLSKRVVLAGSTVHHTLAGSIVRPVLTATALRRVIRPRGRLVRSLPFTADEPLDRLLERVNTGAVSAAPPKTTPLDLPTVDDLAGRTGSRRFRWLWFAVLILAALLAVAAVFLLPPGAALLVLLVPAVVAVVAARALIRGLRAARVAEAIRPGQLTPAAVDALPHLPDFVLTAPGTDVRPRPGTADSLEAARLKEALRDSYGLLQAAATAGTPPDRPGVDLAGLTTSTFDRLDPAVVVPTRILSAVVLPERIRAQLGERFVEAMAYPEFDTPMYEPLTASSAELFLPNINLLANNSITLLETNQRFIEAFLVGLNHEFARELLWREYPTDQRGSYFRQFWDVRGYRTGADVDPAARKEALRDIPPLHLWPKASKLGDHDHRETDGAAEDDIVLTIRGEVLKRYPTAVVYAHRAAWQLTEDGDIDTSKERVFADLPDDEVDDASRATVRTPLYEAKVDPDIYFFGFDLTVTEARGGTGADPGDDPGWFFVIKERPGEPRFGLDADQQPVLNVWNDLSWADVRTGPGAYLRVNDDTPALPLVEPTGAEAEEMGEQYQDDRHVSWHAGMSAADLAYLLFQAPVLVGVHAAEMLPT